MEHINNVCFCKCHKLGQARCRKCKSFHIADEQAATHINDKNNPNILEGVK